MEGNGSAFFVVLALVLAVLQVWYCKKKVEDHVRKHCGEIAQLEVSWTLFGPFAPGRGSLKYLVKITRPDNSESQFYAITSFFSSVYVREGE